MIDNPDSIFPPANQPVPPPTSHTPISGQEPGQAPPASNAPGRPSRRLTCIVVALIGGVFACLCLGLLAGVGLFAVVSSETSNLENTIDRYMSAMANMDAETAYGLLSTHAKTGLTLEELKAEMHTGDLIEYGGYVKVSIDSTRYYNGFTSDNETPTPETADVQGIITYTGGGDAYFTATLVQENGEWKLEHIQSTGSPSRNLQG